MPPEPPRPDAQPPEDGVYLDSQAHPRPPLDAERRPLSPEQEGEDDRLEPPGLRTGVIVGVGAGLMVFMAVSIALMVGLYRFEAGQVADPPPRPFPLPRLETNINPRVLPAVEPGAAQARMPVVPTPSGPDLERAMQMVAAKGAHAYDPLSPPTQAQPTPSRQARP